MLGSLPDRFDVDLPHAGTLWLPYGAATPGSFASIALATLLEAMG